MEWSMFFNPDIGFFITLFLAIFLVMATCIAHLFWFARLTFSSAIVGRPRAARIAVLIAAFALPVASFYAFYVARWWRSLKGELTLEAFRPLAFVTITTLAMAVFGTFRLTLRFPSLYSGWFDMLENLIGLGLIFAAVQLLLFMILRTAAPRWRKAHIAGAAIVLMPFLIFA
jgi:hypothetical protein